jgi:hypothetical protein
MAKASKPNISVICDDGIRRQNVSAYAWARWGCTTPNMDPAFYRVGFAQVIQKPYSKLQSNNKFL